MKLTPAATSALIDGNMENLIIATTPGGIERQEAMEQTKFVNSSALPKNMINGCTKELLEEMGIKFLEESDDIFVKVELPEGWKVSPTDHSMWSDLLDNKGRKRAGIFYKGAFYDRHAHIALSNRFWVSSYERSDCEEGFVKVVVMDGDTIAYEAGTCSEHDFDQNDIYCKIAKEWLTKNYPDWNNPLAYWG